MVFIKKMQALFEKNKLTRQEECVIEGHKVIPLWRIKMKKLEELEDILRKVNREDADPEVLDELKKVMDAMEATYLDLHKRVIHGYKDRGVEVPDISDLIDEQRSTLNRFEGIVGELSLNQSGTTLRDNLAEFRKDIDEERDSLIGRSANTFEANDDRRTKEVQLMQEQAAELKRTINRLEECMDRRSKGENSEELLEEMRMALRGASGMEQVITECDYTYRHLKDCLAERKDEMYSLNSRMKDLTEVQWDEMQKKIEWVRSAAKAAPQLDPKKANDPNEQAIAHTDLTALAPTPKDSPELQATKEETLAVLSEKGYPQAQRILADMYKDRGDKEKAQVQLKRLQDNEFISDVDAGMVHRELRELNGGKSSTLDQVKTLVVAMKRLGKHQKMKAPKKKINLQIKKQKLKIKNQKQKLKPRRF